MLFYLDLQILNGCHDANMETKSGKFFVFFITKLGLLQYVHNIRPRAIQEVLFVKAEEEDFFEDLKNNVHSDIAK